MSTTLQQPKPGSFQSQAEYYEFLKSQRPIRGEEWYQRKMEEAKQREQLRGEKRRLSDTAWRDAIKAWGSDPSAIMQVLDSLDLGAYEETSKVNYRYKSVAGNALLVLHQNCRFWFQDSPGLKTLKGKASGKGVLSLACAVMELRGLAQPYQEAKKFLIGVSGIVPANAQMTPEELEALRAKVAARKVAPPPPTERVEVEISPDLVPIPINNKAQLASLRKLVAEERGFPVEYVQEMEKEGAIYFGTSPKMKRPCVASPVYGFDTGKMVAISTRKIAALNSYGPKGICEGQISMGAMHLGKFDWEKTKRLYLTEGLYDAGALRLQNRRAGVDTPETSYMALAGARVPDRLVELCGQRGIELVAAFDNDIAGKVTEKNLREACEKYGTTLSSAPIIGGEVEVALPDTALGQAFFRKIVSGCYERELPMAFLPPSRDGRMRVVLRTNDASCEMLAALRHEAHAALKVEKERSGKPQTAPDQEKDSASRNRDKDGEKFLDLKWHRKDWNELELNRDNEYKQQARTTSGLPMPDPANEALSRTILERIFHLDPRVAAQLVRQQQVYATAHSLVLPLTDTQGRPMGAVGYPLQGGAPRMVGDRQGIVWLAGATPVTQHVVVADTVERAIEAWADSRYTAAVAIVPGRKMTAELQHEIETAHLPVHLRLEQCKAGLKMQSEVEAEAQRLGLPVETVLTKSPLVTVTLDARKEEEKKRAEAEAMRLHELAYKNQQQIQIFRTKDGYVQIKMENHAELLKDLEGIDEDCDGKLDAGEVETTAAEHSKRQRVVIEYHGRGIDRTEVSQDYQGYQPKAEAAAPALESAVTPEKDLKEETTKQAAERMDSPSEIHEKTRALANKPKDQGRDIDDD